MASKIILNVIYNLAILTFGFMFMFDIKHEHYLLSVLCAAGIGLIIFFKLRLIKQVKEDARNKKNK